MSLASRIRLVIVTAVLLAIGSAYAALYLARLWKFSDETAWAGVAVVGVLLGLWAAHLLISRFDELYAVLGNALRAFRDRDFTLRLTVRGDAETAELKRLYNELADVVRADRNEIYQKEVLLDTVLQRTPVAVALLNQAGRVIYSNAASRELLANGGRLDGRLLDEIAMNVEAPLQEALRSGSDAIFSVPRGDREETFHVTQRTFHLNAQVHHLLLIERLTPELRRQELAVWKNAIRLINHEINNSLAPVRSLFHSARRAQESPEHRHKVGEIHRLLEEHLNTLQSFLESYAQLARVPEPHKERTRWSEVFAAVSAIYPFRTNGQAGAEGFFDRKLMQQVLINLVKNAVESGSDPNEVMVTVHSAGNDWVLRVLDRGRGMSEEVMRKALLPFYTTKAGGTGIGLALCNEIIEAHGGHMRIQGREGRGTVVTCWIPQ